MKKFIILSLLAAMCMSSAQELYIYSERHYTADKKIFAEFTEKTGIEVKVIKAGADELLARLKSEAKAPVADVYITKDAAQLDRATKAGLLAPLNSPIIEAQVPAELRGKENTWTSITMRGRVIVYAKDRVKDQLPVTYMDLADEKYRGRVLVRSSSSAYNRSLLASIINNQGKQEALKWAQGITHNMARPPQGGDRDQIRAVAQGIGDFAITNTYYLGIMETSDSETDRQARDAVNIIFPKSGEQGTHVNVSGAGIVKGAKNVENARLFLEFLVSNDIQIKYQKLTSEYAVAKGVEFEQLQKNWGELSPDTQSLHSLIEYNADAVKLLGIAGWQ